MFGTPLNTWVITYPLWPEYKGRLTFDTMLFAVLLQLAAKTCCGAEAPKLVAVSLRACRSYRSSGGLIVAAEIY